MNPFFYKLAEARQDKDEQNPYLIPGAIAGVSTGVAPGFALKSREAAKERGSAKKSIKETSGLISDLEGTKRAVERYDLTPRALDGLENAMTKHKKELDRLNIVKKKATKRMLGFGAGSTLAAAGAAYGGKKLYDTYKARNQDKTAAKAPTFSAAYDDSPELKGGQKRLPDSLQKKIVISKLKSRVAKRGKEKGLLMQKRAEKKQRPEDRTSIAPAALGVGLVGLGAGGKALADYASPKLRQRALEAYLETKDIVAQGHRVNARQIKKFKDRDRIDELEFLAKELGGRENSARKTRLDDISAITKKYKKMLRNLSASEKVKFLRDARVRSALGIAGAGSLYASVKKEGAND